MKTLSDLPLKNQRKKKEMVHQLQSMAKQTRLRENEFNLLAIKSEEDNEK